MLWGSQRRSKEQHARSWCSRATATTNPFRICSTRGMPALHTRPQAEGIRQVIVRLLSTRRSNVSEFTQALVDAEGDGEKIKALLQGRFKEMVALIPNVADDEVEVVAETILTQADNLNLLVSHTDNSPERSAELMQLADSFLRMHDLAPKSASNDTVHLPVLS
jgi:hypothetical protein